MLLANNETQESPEIFEEPQLGPGELFTKYAEMDERFYSEIKPFLDEFKAVKLAVIESHAIGEMWQAADGTVYQVADKKGQWVDFTPYEIKRTRRPGEAKGSLSLTEAKANGFTVTEAK